MTSRPGVGGLGRAWGLWIVAIALVAGGCASRRPPAGTTVRKIRFEGNPGLFTSLGDARLRQRMAHELPGFRPWPVRRRVSLDRDALPGDLERIQIALAHEGYFDATVGWRIDTHRAADEEGERIVDLVGEVSLGGRSRIRSSELEGVAELPRRVRRRLRAVTRVDDEMFSLQEHEARKAQLEGELRRRGYPTPEVGGDVLVDRSEHDVALDYEVQSGPRARYGATRIDGLEKVPERSVRRALGYREGELFDITDLQRTRSRLYGMDVFTLVGIEPLAVDEEGQVPIHVLLEEGAPRTLAARVGLGLQSGRQEALVGGSFTHLNALGRLLEVRLDAEVGVAALASDLSWIGTEETVVAGIVGETSAELGAADLVAPGVDATLRVGFDREVTEAFTTDRPSAFASLDWRTSPDLVLSLGYRFDFTRYSQIRIEPSELDRIDVAPDLQDGRFVNARIVPRVVWDRRDDVVAPTRGTFVDARIDLAGAWLGGNYNYNAVRLDLRGYRGVGGISRRLRRWLRLDPDELVIAARLSGGIITPYGPDERRVVPVSERLYLGGTGSARGWTYRSLGPYVCDADDTDPCRSTINESPGEDADTVPVGGRVSTLATLELRKTWGLFRGVVFTDVGMVWATVDDLQRLAPQPSVGLGGRVLTPVGPIRFDVAVRVTNPPIFEPEPRLWFHIGLGEAF